MRFINTEKTEAPDGTPDWLQVIHAVNAGCIAAGAERLFGRPTSSGPWWAGGSVEEYPRARVIHRDDGTVNLEGLDDEANTLIEQAAATLTTI